MNHAQLLFASIIFLVGFHQIVHATDILSVAKFIGMMICVWYLQNTVQMMTLIQTAKKKHKEDTNNEKNIGYHIS